MKWVLLGPFYVVLRMDCEINKLDGERIHPKLSGAIIGEMRKQHLQGGRIDYLEVIEVKAGTAADTAGFETGDVIFSINKQLTRRFDELLKIVESNDNGILRQP